MFKWILCVVNKIVSKKRKSNFPLWHFLQLKIRWENYTKMKEKLTNIIWKLKTSPQKSHFLCFILYIFDDDCMLYMLKMLLKFNFTSLAFNYQSHKMEHNIECEENEWRINSLENWKWIFLIIMWKLFSIYTCTWAKVSFLFSLYFYCIVYCCIILFIT